MSVKYYIVLRMKLSTISPVNDLMGFRELVTDEFFENEGGFEILNSFETQLETFAY